MGSAGEEVIIRAGTCPGAEVRCLKAVKGVGRNCPVTGKGLLSGENRKKPKKKKKKLVGGRLDKSSPSLKQ